jgi:hypothetical protein
LNKLKSTEYRISYTSIPNTKHSEFTVGLDNLGFGKFKCLELIIARIKMGLKAVVLDWDFGYKKNILIT